MGRQSKIARSSFNKPSYSRGQRYDDERHEDPELEVGLESRITVPLAMWVSFWKASFSNGHKNHPVSNIFWWLFNKLTRTLTIVIQNDVQEGNWHEWTLSKLFVLAKGLKELCWREYSLFRSQLNLEKHHSNFIYNYQSNRKTSSFSIR